MPRVSRLKSLLKEAAFQAVPASRLCRRGPKDRKQVALTFDDGPDAMTSAYLDRLEELGVPATFFVVGKFCEAHPELAREYVRRGHQVASHGYDHTHFTRLGFGALKSQLRKTARVLGPRATARPWVRPPYGNLNARVLAQLLADGQLVAMWSLDSLDYELHDPDAVAARCAPSVVSPGEVILLHEGQSWTLDALPRIVGALRDAGYELVTMAKMFEDA